MLFLQNLHFSLWLVTALQQSGCRQSRGWWCGRAGESQLLPYFQSRPPSQSSQCQPQRPFKTQLQTQEMTLHTLGLFLSFSEKSTGECLLLTWWKGHAVVWWKQRGRRPPTAQKPAGRTCCLWRWSSAAPLPIASGLLCCQSIKEGIFRKVPHFTHLMT